MRNRTDSAVLNDPYGEPNRTREERLRATDRRFTVTQSDFDRAIEGYRQALHAYVTGDPGPVTGFFSRREDVTLANPLGPPRIGPAEVDQAAAEGAALLRDGSVRGFEEASRYSTPDLGYVVQLERTQARLPGSEDMVPFALRVTMIFRREGDSWKVAHRHADPITTPRPISTVIET
jgi:ketosteroid isomerase-like protein